MIRNIVVGFIAGQAALMLCASASAWGVPELITWPAAVALMVAALLVFGDLEARRP